MVAGHEKTYQVLVRYTPEKFCSPCFGSEYYSHLHMYIHVFPRITVVAGSLRSLMLVYIVVVFLTLTHNTMQSVVAG